MLFDIQPEEESIIKVIGVGGGGSNAVNFMYKQGIEGVNFIICNTDKQALANSEVPVKIQLGPSLTGGRGAGARPEVGREATLESEEEIRRALGSNTQMVFVTAGMGGGTGTGGAPEVAKIAKEMGILTVGIVTVPFDFEGKSKREKADMGLNELRNNVDALIVISNNKLRKVFGNLSLSAAFSHADNVLTTAARGISEIITKPGMVNVDFEDVKTVMKDSGVAIMGIGIAAGEDRAVKAIDAALSSPLLDDNDIYGARGILLYISSGNKEVTMDEVSQITDYVQQAANNDTEIIWGVCQDPALDEEVSVTLIATGFGSAGLERPKAKVEKIRIPLDAPEQKVETAPIVKEEVKVVNVKEEQEVTFDMEVPQAAKSIEVMEEPEFVVRKRVEVKETEKSSAAADVNDMDRADMRNEIIRRKIGNVRLNDPNYINEMEKTPAFLRKNKKFEQITHSSQSHLSRYTLTDTFEDENGLTIGLKENSFLSDKPD
jgi:cell division protein FtsZ